MFLSQLTDNVLTRQFNSGHPFILRGRPGISKTQLIIQYCERMGLGLVIENLTSVDAPDMRGFLIPQKTEDGGVTSVYSKPAWLSQIEAMIAKGFTSGILFLDEILAAQHDVIKATAPLMSEEHIGEWYLPEGWVVWGSGNRVKDRAGAQRLLAHAANRALILDVEPDVESLSNYMVKRNMHPLYVAFIHARPLTVFPLEAPKDPDQQVISPRSLEYAHDFHFQGEDEPLATDTVTQAMIAGYIGDAACADLMGYIATADELPTYEEIMANPQGAKVPAETRLDAQLAAIHMCIYHATDDNVDELFTYVMRLRGEMHATAANAMIMKSGGALVTSRVLGQWIASNTALVTATFSA